MDEMKRDYPLFLSQRETEVLKAIGYDGENIKIAHEKLINARTGTYLSDSTVRAHLTRIFKRYMEAMDVMAEYAPVFHGRFEKHKNKIIACQRLRAKRRRDAK